ncbi:uncharacterized protein Nmag_3339 [Natrialba magadii ATCC 43099]|uniref:Uncharacterized protein n=1 Tax=Natrialba magadii (strain ATCC 43099 / DSM 3394 / CCM 3739 / CIP 104546 / IAM 13178 / JCM 8861 / NBRC 102185 / NCIMB 2190 / MS3) TaxID=547559 RepID=D3SSP4_NATMM|nr:uncharacterized protein Nmag_3339 [Natrialba magadii ATCC 43099]
MKGVKLVMFGLQVTLVGALFPNEQHWGLIYFGMFISIIGIIVNDGNRMSQGTPVGE